MQVDNEPLLDDAFPHFMEMVLPLENEMEGEAPLANPLVLFTENEEICSDPAFGESPKEPDKTESIIPELDGPLSFCEARRGTLALTESDDMLVCIRRSQY